jgi:hypothetical protein
MTDGRHNDDENKDGIPLHLINDGEFYELMNAKYKDQGTTTDALKVKRDFIAIKSRLSKAEKEVPTKEIGFRRRLAMAACCVLAFVLIQNLDTTEPYEGLKGQEGVIPVPMEIQSMNEKTNEVTSFEKGDAILVIKISPSSEGYGVVVLKSKGKTYVHHFNLDFEGDLVPDQNEIWAYRFYGPDDFTVCLGKAIQKTSLEEAILAENYDGMNCVSR